MLKTMRKTENCNSSKNYLGRIGKEETKSIERGLQDIKEGRVHSHEIARKIYEKYL
jgi:predicted transcriptional regulator